MDAIRKTAPGPLPRPPNRPPDEPIIIRMPPRLPDDVEVETPGSAEVEISPVPHWTPDLPPPLTPEERAAHGIRGLHENDFILAAKLDRIARA